MTKLIIGCGLLGLFVAAAVTPASEPAVMATPIWAYMAITTIWVAGGLWFTITGAIERALGGNK